MRKIKYFLFTLVVSIIGIGSVRAESACPSTTLYEEQKAVSEMTVTYEEVKTEVKEFDDVYDDYYLAIIIHNVPDNVKIDIKVSTKNNTANTSIDSSAREEDGSIYYLDKEPYELKNYQISVKSTSTECNGKNLKTLQLNTPMLNPFTNSNSCEQYPGFKWCHVFVNYDLTKISEREFNKALENYENKIDEETKTEAEKKKENKEKKDYRNVILIGVLALALGGLITYNVIKKKKGSKMI